MVFSFFWFVQESVVVGFFVRLFVWVLWVVVCFFGFLNPRAATSVCMSESAPLLHSMTKQM